MKFDHANIPSTRRDAYRAYEGRLAINTELLSTTLSLRRQIAEALQYNSWADYATEVKMSKNAANVKQVSNFIHRLSLLHDLDPDAHSFWMSSGDISTPLERKN